MTVFASLNPELWTWLVLPLLIFCARIMDVSIGTVRIIFVSKGYRYAAAFLGFFEVLIWLTATMQIIRNLTNPINYVAYAAGFAMGNFVGIRIESRLAMGTVLIRVITRLEASDLVQHLRERGHTVTSLDAEGNRGLVKVFFTIVKRKEIPAVIDVIKQYNPNAFYTIENVNFVNQRWRPAPRLPSTLWELIGWKRK
jgi:uncharacterized protein YebE (UPF0316 family)